MSGAMGVGNLYIGIFQMLEGLPYDKRLRLTTRIFTRVARQCLVARSESREGRA